MRDAIVVGGGPAGSATAIGLARAGLDVLLLDARSFPRSKPCGDAVSPGAIPLLEDLGVWSAVSEGPCELIEGWEVRAPGGRWFESLFDTGRPGSPARGVCVDRRRLDNLLIEAARDAGVEVRERSRAFDLTTSPEGRVDGVIARGPDGDPIAVGGHMVVGADGLRSRVARRLGPVRRGGRARLALVSRWGGFPGTPGRGEMRISRDGVLGLASLGNGEANLTLVVPTGRAHALAPDPMPYFLHRAAEYGLSERLARARLLRPIEVTGPFEVTPSRRTAPGALLVGDATGYFDPFTGQGVFRALDGARLATDTVLEVLGGTKNEAAALARYEAHLDRRLRVSRTLQRGIDFAVSRPPIIDRLAAVLQRWPDLASWLADATGDRVRWRAYA